MKSNDFFQQKAVRDRINLANFEFLHSQRGGLVLCVNNFILSKGNVKEGVEYYYCNTSTCKSSARVKDGKLTILQGVHDHPNDQDKIKRLKLVLTIRKRAVEEPLVPLSKIFKQELEKFRIEEGVSEVDDLPSFASLSSTMYRDRKNGLQR